MTVSATGFGAGGRDLEGRPNVVQVVVGSARAAEATPGQPVVLLEANVDDATGEVLAHAVGRLLDAGAHDAWITPIVMKKGRPAHTVAALVDPVDAGRIAARPDRRDGLARRPGRRDSTSGRRRAPSRPSTSMARRSG